MTDKIVVFSTCSSAEEAETLARRLLDQHLAACVNVVPGVRSFYWWQGKIEDSAEFLLVIKSSRAHFPKLGEALSAAHSYQVPEIVALQIVDGSPAYLDWLDRELAT